MKKFTLFFLFSLIASTFGIKAQNIQDGVLIGWPMASGDIKIPDGVVEIAPNCFHESGGGDWGGDDDWDGAPAFGKSLRSSNDEITSVDFNQVKKIGKEAFKECKGIKSVKMPNVEEIGEEARLAGHQTHWQERILQLLLSPKGDHRWRFGRDRKESFQQRPEHYGIQDH